MRKNIPGIFYVASYLSVLTVFVLTTLVACSSLPWPKFATKIDSKILASFEINPDANGRPSPLVVRVYELKANNSFNDADFFKLYDEEEATLGGDLLTRSEFELSPGEGREIVQKAHEQTRYFGIVAAYRNIDNARWRASTELELNKKNTIIVKIEKQSVTIDHR